MDSSRVRIERRERGFSARGPGFYVWDHDAGELLRWAAELTEAVIARRCRAAEESIHWSDPEDRPAR